MLSKFKEELKVAKEFYLISVLDGFIEIQTPLWVIYFLTLGFSPSALGLIFALFFLSMFIFEIPTGAIADHFGRKLSVTLSYLLSGFLFVGVAVSTNFWPILILFVLFGASESLYSGAFNAWLIDKLRHYKKAPESHRYLARDHSIYQLALVPTFFLASLVVVIGTAVGFPLLFILRSLWLVAAFFCFTAAAVAHFFGSEEYFKPRAKLRIADTFRETFKLSKQGIKQCMSHPTLLLLVVADSLLGFAFAVFLIGYQPFLKDILQVPIAWFGALAAISAGLAFIGLTYSDKLLKKRHERDVLLLIYASFLLGSLVFVISPLVGIAILGFVMFSTFIVIAEPLWIHYFNKYVPSKIRATTESVANMFKTLFWAAGIYIGYGVLSEMLGLQNALFLAVIVGAIGLIMLIFIKKA